ncbi:alpha/beta hydrolase family protein [Kineosporia babensis]|uniref:Alpha/beta hydrolase n=1 Tax=Kineosporia babensis TaxID=499548 RepID=A0A9X1NCP9_9ACTN|nr:alpha/beta hydrolase [Kineosporia babensis]MCD5310623.1 alpha/beta hydrolase [Kineosporia babensis]
MPTVRRRFLFLVTLVTAGLLFGSQAHAEEPPTHQRGPAPTAASIAAEQGPFTISQASISGSDAEGFGGADIYYPTDTSQGRFGAVAMSTGFIAQRSSLKWLAARLASHGFVVVNINTKTRGDQPAHRGRQLLAALDQATQDGRVRDRIDPGRLAVLGYSLGGGGALEAGRLRPSLKAAVPLTPWSTTLSFPENRVPTMIIGAELDTVAPVDLQAKPFYRSLPDSPGKAYLELDDATHFAPFFANSTMAKYSVAWLKLFVDDDQRYRRFVCPGPAHDRSVSDYRNTCS